MDWDGFIKQKLRVKGRPKRRIAAKPYSLVDHPPSPGRPSPVTLSKWVVIGIAFVSRRYHLLNTTLPILPAVHSKGKPGNW
jgi:hypothetical protein